MGNIRKNLKLLSLLIGQAEFPTAQGEKKNSGDTRIVKVHDTVVDMFSIKVISCSGPLKYLRPDRFGYDLPRRRGDRAYIIFLPIDNGPKEVRTLILRKVSLVVSNEVKSRGICDSETEAYMFGYLASRIMVRHMEDCMSDVVVGPKKREVTWKVPKTDVTVYFSASRKFIIPTDPDSKFTLSKSSGGSVCSVLGSTEFVVLFGKENIGNYLDCINVWAHELYHLSRNSYGILNAEYFRMSDLLEQYAEASLPVLRYLLWKVNS